MLEAIAAFLPLLLIERGYSDTCRYTIPVGIAILLLACFLQDVIIQAILFGIVILLIHQRETGNGTVSLMAEGMIVTELLMIPYVIRYFIPSVSSHLCVLCIIVKATAVFVLRYHNERDDIRDLLVINGISMGIAMQVVYCFEKWKYDVIIPMSVMYCFSVYLMIRVISQQKEAQKLKEIQSVLELSRNQMELWKNISEVTIQFRHDVSHHMHVLQELTDQNHIADIKQYLNVVGKHENTEIYSCDAYLDAILRYHIHLYPDIQWNLDVHYSHVNNRFSIDLSLILSRLFHDAVCQMVSDRGVDVIIHQMESMVLVKVAYQKGNNEDMDLAWLDDMLKPYHGNVEVQDGERHCIMLMLQLPMEND